MSHRFLVVGSFLRHTSFAILANNQTEFANNFFHKWRIFLITAFAASLYFICSTDAWMLPPFFGLNVRTIYAPKLPFSILIFSKVCCCTWQSCRLTIEFYLTLHQHNNVILPIWNGNMLMAQDLYDAECYVLCFCAILLLSLTELFKFEWRTKKIWPNDEWIWIILHSLACTAGHKIHSFEPLWKRKLQI